MTPDNPFSADTLAIISSKHCWQDPEGIKTIGGFGRQIEAFQPFFKRIILAVPFEQRATPAPGYCIRIANLEIMPLPYFDGTGLAGKVKFLFQLPRVVRQVGRTYRKSSLVQVRLPGYIGVIAMLVHKFQPQTPVFAWIGTDWPERIRQSGAGLHRRVLAFAAGQLMHWLTRRISAFALGQLAVQLQATNPYCHPIISTVLSEDNIVRHGRESLSQPPRLLFVGRLVKEKGIYDLIHAVGLCRQQGINCHLTLVGDGPEKAGLEQLAAELGLEPAITFAGYVALGEALWQLYRQSDVFVLPSLSEGQGKVLVEAMASGLAIVATRVGGIPSLIKHGENGLLVAPHAPDELAAAIQHLLTQHADRQQLVAKSLMDIHTMTIETQTNFLIEQLAGDLISQGRLRHASR